MGKSQTNKIHEASDVYFSFVLVTILGSYFFIANMHQQFAGDWTDYFGPLTLFTRSSFWHYGSFPLHFPWRCGGSDLMVNPQTRLFSPFVLLDIFLVPQWSLLSTILIFGVLGSIAVFKLLEALEVKRSAAIVGAILFNNSSWFALHFTEGHLTYAEMQLLPAVLLFIKGIELRKNQFLLFSLFGLFLLNGAIQALIYSILLIGCAFFIFPEMGKKILDLRYAYMGKLMFVISLVTAPKLIPVWLTLKKREPMLDTTVMSARLLFTSLYYPWQEFRMASVTQGTPYVFHEYGCYLGWIGTGLCLLKSIEPSWRKANARLLFFFFFWLWIGSGWGAPFNPWSLLQRIPLVNQAHLQSRLFILLFIFFIVLVARALEKTRIRGWFLFLSVLMILESSFVRLHITRFLMGPFAEKSVASDVLIRNDNLDKTVYSGIPISHYLKKNLSAIDCNERAFFPSQVKSVMDPSYQGEIYFSEGRGEVSLLNYVPAKITGRYATTTGGIVHINTNHLWGWRPLTPNVQIVSQHFGENIKIQVAKGTGTFTLVYSPKYLTVCLILFFVGVVLYLLEVGKLVRNGKLISKKIL